MTVTKRTFPYPVHPAAHLGPMDEDVVLDLMDRIRTFGYSEVEPILLYRGSVLDGRHRQEACVRLGIEPPVAKVDLQGQTPHEFVMNRHHLRTITAKQRTIFAIESFPEEGSVKLLKRLGDNTTGGNQNFGIKSDVSRLRQAWKKAKKKDWEDYKAGRITQNQLFEKVGMPLRKAAGVSKAEYEEKVTENRQLDDDIQVLAADLADREQRIKELEKRIKSLDPTERIHRAAMGETTVEDELRDRLEFSEDELKKTQKINERLADQLRSQERIGSKIADALTGIDWGAPVAPPVKRPTGQLSGPREFLALISDAHYGEVVSPEEAMGIEYNCEIAEKRILKYRDVILDLKATKETAYPVPKITLAVLGDMLSGMIHEELTATNEKVVSEQSAEMASILWGVTKSLAAEFEEVELIIIPGNHTRLVKKPYHKQKWNTFEYGMGSAIKMAFEEAQIPNVTFQLPKSLVYLHKIFDFQIGMYHGDGIKSASFAGIPFYGLKSQRDALQSMLSSLGLPRVDALVMGHFHQHVYWTGECDVLINGSIKGPDEYIMSTRLAATEAEQVLLEFDPRHGLTAQEHIKLGQVI